MNEYCGGFTSSMAAADYGKMAQMVDDQMSRANALLEGSGWELKGYNPNQPRGKSSAASNRGSFASCGGWPNDFPVIKPMTSGMKLKSHPDYEAAKAGDIDAAFKVVRDVIKLDKVLELGRLYPKAKIIPIRAEEAAGRNKLPVSFAHRIGKLTGLEIESAIGQNNRVHHTGAEAVERFISRAQFKGEVEAGRDYIIVDDFVTLGGTISELRQYIESNGGRVVAATALAVGGNARIGSSSNLALQESTRIALHKHFSHNALHEFLKENGIYNGNINALTNSEGKWLLTFSGIDSLRVRIAHARDERESRTGRRAVSPGTRAVGEAEAKALAAPHQLTDAQTCEIDRKGRWSLSDARLNFSRARIAESRSEKKSDGGAGIYASAQSGARRAREEAQIKSLAVSPITDTLIHYGGGIKTLAADPPLHSSIIAAIDYDNMAQMLSYQLGRADALLERSGWELKGYNPNQPRGKSSTASNSGSFTSSGSFRAVPPREFVKARNQSKRMSFLSDVSPDDLKEHHLYLAHGGKVGYALNQHGDLQNVFNNGGPKGAGGDAIIDAIKNGAKTLDCFSGYLSKFYARYGFVPTGYMKFNDDFAPKDWDYEQNERPDIIFMAYQGGDRATIEDRVGTFNEPLQTAKRYYTDWDSAKADSRTAAMGHDPDGQRGHYHRKALTGESPQRHNKEHSGPLGRPQGRVRVRQELLSDVTDTLIHYGGSIKTLEETGDGWRFGGWLVVFGSHDASRFKDKFTAQTDFDIEDGERRGLYYNHGLDGTIKRTKLGDCRVFVKEAGVWIEGQIRKRTDYLKSHAEKIAANIESFGLSSGAPAHLVERKAVPGGHEILLWPLAEASITPTPAEPLTGCFSLKALVEGAGHEALGDEDFVPGCFQPSSSSTFLDHHSAGLRDGLAFDDHCARVLAAVGELQERVDGLAQMRCVKSKRRWSAGKYETLSGLADGLGQAAQRIESLAQEHAPCGDESEALQALARFEAVKARMNGVNG